MFGQRRDDNDEKLAERRLLTAASGDVDPAAGPPPFFVSRVRASANAVHVSGGALGATAWRMLPALAALALVVLSMVGYESVQLGRDREAAVERMLTAQGGGDIVVAVMLFAGQDAGGAE